MNTYDDEAGTRILVSHAEKSRSRVHAFGTRGDRFER